MNLKIIIIIICSLNCINKYFVPTYNKHKIDVETYLYIINYNMYNAHYTMKIEHINVNKCVTYFNIRNNLS